MKSFFRIYAKTSKGNDNHLLNQLRSFNLKPKYDQHLNSFYFNSNFMNLFDISFRSLAVEQMYVQIGQKFRIIDQQQIKYELERFPFKTFIPIKRGLIQNTTLKILIRQSSNLPSENVLINLFTTNLHRQIVKKEYYKQILQPNSQQNSESIQSQQSIKDILEYRDQRRTNQSFFQIKEIVQKKWFHQDSERQKLNSNKILQLEREIKTLRIQANKSLISFHSQNKAKNQNSDALSSLIQNNQIKLANLENKLIQLKNFNHQHMLTQNLTYHPHLIFYIRKNQGRILLKINKDDLYKHGWKNSVNWGPIRQSIAASVLHQSKILKSQQHNSNIVKIWDPMCGSGTFPLVAATMIDQIPIRNNVDKLFQWKNWPIFKEQYLTQYWTQRANQKKRKALQYKLIMSDKDRQTINYSINNFKLLLQNIKVNEGSGENEKQAQKLTPSKTGKSQVLQLVENKIGFICGDFEEVIKILIPKKQQLLAQQFSKLNIITNLPYLHGRSVQKHPLNQLISVYKRFNKMLRQYKQYIDNAFIMIDKNINDKNHFLNVSTEQWTLISEFISGGMNVGLYAWNQNKIKPVFFDETQQLSLHNSIQLSSQQRQFLLKKQKSAEKALIQYRKRLSQIDRKYYRLPKHLTKDAKGWKRILQKRRKRHLQSAYELFARKRDKMIALKQYAHQKLEIRMLRRGTVWKNKNLRFFNNNDSKLESYSQQIKQIFQKKIESALKREEEYQQKRKIKSGNKIQVAKIINKWNNDESKMVKQIKNSNGFRKRQKKHQNFSKKR